jgi:hypothetical protein
MRERREKKKKGTNEKQKRKGKRLNRKQKCFPLSHHQTKKEARRKKIKECSVKF